MGKPVQVFKKMGLEYALNTLSPYEWMTKQLKDIILINDEGSDGRI